MRLVSLLLLISSFITCEAQNEQPGFWQICQNAANQLKSGLYKEAENSYKTALKCAYDEEDIEKVHVNLSSIYEVTGRFDDALNELALCSNNDNVIIHRSNIFLRKGEYKVAIELLDTVIEHSTPNSNYWTIAHQNKGYVYWCTKDYHKAKDEMELAIPNLSGQVKSASLGNYAIILANIQKYDEAINAINAAISKVNINSNDYIILLRKKAKILLMMDNRNEAQKIYKQYFIRQKEFVARNFSSMTEQNRLDFWKTIKPNINELFALENDCPDFLLDVALLRREIALLGNSDKAEMETKINVSGQQLRKSLQQYELAVDFVRYEKNDTARYGAIIVPSYAMKSKIRFVPLWTEQDLHGFMIDNIIRLDDALCSDNLLDKDRLYTDSLLRDFVWKKLDDTLKQYDYEDIYFAPDGLLHLLAIEYLREDNGVCLHRMSSLTKLMERNKHRISVKSKLLAAGGFDYDTEETKYEMDSCVNHDAMDYLKMKLKNVDKPFGYLHGAKEEIDSISKNAPFMTDTATNQTERMIKEHIRNKKYDILHFSTHGYSLDIQVPITPVVFIDSITEDKSLLASGIAFTGANIDYRHNNKEDGIISAREFCEMDMSNIDLMVLSACQTGLGRFCDEGPAGLVRGLKKAGVGSLIVSLWSVSDEATMLFMKHLYKAIREQSTPDIHAAFNTARLNFSKETRLVRQFNPKRMKTERFGESYNLPRFCNSFILIDSIK